MGQLESSATSYASSIKSKITTALEIQEGLNAIKYYEKMGLITRPSMKPVSITEERKAEINATFNLPKAQKKRIAEMAFARIKGGATIKQAAKELGLNSNTLRTWLIKYGRYNPKKGKSNEFYENRFDDLLRLVNEESWPLLKAGEKLGITKVALQSLLLRREYKYNKKTLMLVKN